MEQPLKITNNFEVPAPLVTLASREYYSKGSSQYSVTELLSPPRVRRLREQYDAQLTQDVADMLWPLLGSALHVVMERGITPGWISEERLYAEVDGVTISGQIDLQQETPTGVILHDYKFTSVWAVMNDKTEWEEQLNLYGWLVRTVKKTPVEGLKICALLRDWSRHDVSKPGYPPAQIHVLDIPVWDHETATKFVAERLDHHRESKVSQNWGDKLPECSPQERWQSETTYAVRREGRKTAIRVFKSLEEATQLAKQEQGYVETRLGESKRCTGNYCGVAEFCEQFRAQTAQAECE
jgi:hypothetical protein